MTKKQQRIAIAKACGLKIVSDGINHHLTPCRIGGGFDPDGKGLTQAPDYLNDLNAMHEAEKIIEDKRDYTEELSLITSCGKTSSPFPRTVMATASQRAEAFLKTLGLWKDE